MGIKWMRNSDEINIKYSFFDKFSDDALMKEVVKF